MQSWCHLIDFFIEGIPSATEAPEIFKRTGIMCWSQTVTNYRVCIDLWNILSGSRLADRKSSQQSNIGASSGATTGSHA